MVASYFHSSVASGVTDDKVLDGLLENKISSESLAAFALVPLVEVAWADGSLAAKEREAILSAASQDGLHPGQPGGQLLQQWLEKKPATQLLDSWKAYVSTLCQALGKEEAEALKTTVLGRARRVAEAAGGILGLGNKISESESSVLAELERAFE